MGLGSNTRLLLPFSTGPTLCQIRGVGARGAPSIQRQRSLGPPAGYELDQRGRHSGRNSLFRLDGARPGSASLPTWLPRRSGPVNVPNTARPYWQGDEGRWPNRLKAEYGAARPFNTGRTSRRVGGGGGNHAVGLVLSKTRATAVACHSPPRGA